MKTTEGLEVQIVAAAAVGAAAVTVATADQKVHQVVAAGQEVLPGVAQEGVPLEIQAALLPADEAAIHPTNLHPEDVRVFLIALEVHHRVAAALLPKEAKKAVLLKKAVNLQ
jgi:hypothetical protein